MAIISPPTYVERPPSYASLFLQTSFEGAEGEERQQGTRLKVSITHGRQGGARAGDYVCYDNYVQSEEMPIMPILDI